MKKGFKFLLLTSSMVLLAACTPTEEAEVDTTVSSEEVIVEEEVSEDLTETTEDLEDATDADTESDVTEGEVTENTTENPVDDAGMTEIADNTESDDASDSEAADVVDESAMSELESEMASDEETTEDAEAEIEPIEVDMMNADGESVGTATFEETDAGVTLTLELEGLPEGEYGMHIHENGMATPPTFEDAGSHYNPTDVEHGTESDTGPHLGDLPNLEVGEDGTVSMTIDIPDVTLQADAENTLNTESGTALIIHTEADDYMSQPTGDAGDRMVGGVIFAPLNEEETEVESTEEDSEETTEIESVEMESEETSEESSE